MSNFVNNNIKTIMRYIFQYFEEFYNQDALLVWTKTVSAMIVLNIPQYLPEVQGGAKLASTIIGLGSAILGFVLLCFKIYDELRKRFKR